MLPIMFILIQTKLVLIKLNIVLFLVKFFELVKIN